MIFREALDKIEGLRSVADSLELMSAAGRALLMDSPFLTDRRAIEAELHAVEVAGAFFGRVAADRCGEAERLLMQVRDIRNTLSRLDAGQCLDDVEFFEIKGLALAASAMKRLLETVPASLRDCFPLPSLDDIIGILDPEHTGNSHFHIYNAYSEELTSKRAELRRMQESPGYDRAESDGLVAECMRLEGEVRERLSADLRPSGEILHEALATLARLDLTMAKARLASSQALVRPAFGGDEICFGGLRFLPVESMLRSRGKEFQPVDIAVRRGVTLITGTNMGGKTITLKSVALAQAMAQFGFFVAASRASTVIVESIEQSIGDPQSAGDGLSSFGAEIVRLDAILSRAAEGSPKLILIDEPARTTNPEEGEAITDAVLDILGSLPVFALVTSHYGNLTADCRRLKVAGLKSSAPTGVALSPASLTAYIDYSLLPAPKGAKAREALRIAGLLGIQPHFFKTIEEKIKK